MQKKVNQEKVVRGTEINETQPPEVGEPRDRYPKTQRHQHKPPHTMHTDSFFFCFFLVAFAFSNLVKHPTHITNPDSSCHDPCVPLFARIPAQPWAYYAPTHWGHHVFFFFFSTSFTPANSVS